MTLSLSSKDRISSPNSNSNPLQHLDLGPLSSFDRFPARVTIAGRAYFLTKNEQSYKLLSVICPHKGDIVLDAGDVFECPSHGWTFERESGRCLNTPDSGLRALTCRVEDGHLIAEVPLSLTLETIRRTKRKTALEDLNITLHAHACLQFDHRGFELLLDPWLVGPAHVAAWVQFPPPIVDVNSLDPDAILITHEHSDHFHEPTLSKFRRDQPIYVPDFPNRRMVERLAAMGFSDIRPLPFGERTQLAHEVFVTLFEPDSSWNDSIALIEIDDFRILDLNDAGLNQRIAARVGAVDVVASAFSSGASGYPLEWYHLTDEQKDRIMTMASESKLQMLQQAVGLYKCDYLLPFASHFGLWHPLHRQYREVMKRNTLDDVVRTFATSPVKVIDLLPGERWNAATGEFARREGERDSWFSHEFMLSQMEAVYDSQQFERSIPAPNRLSEDELRAYLLRLNDVPEIVFSENLTVILRITEDLALEHSVLEVAFEIAAGSLHLLDAPPAQANQIIVLPEQIMYD